jgi:hypothetical protein
MQMRDWLRKAVFGLEIVLSNHICQCAGLNIKDILGLHTVVFPHNGSHIAPPLHFFCNDEKSYRENEDCQESYYYCYDDTLGEDPRRMKGISA